MSQNNICATDVPKLKKVNICQLSSGKIIADSIMWVKTISEPCYIASLMIIVEDENQDVIFLGLYNQINSGKSLDELNTTFPKGIEIGIKQPYLKLSYSGVVSLRNDNPQNIIIKRENKFESITKDNY